MAGNLNIQSDPAPERSDAELLQTIATDRDEAAFTELFRRYEHAAYGLALQITGSHASAEEAAQEAFLRVWLRAENFRASKGKPRAWLLQIFARESLRIRGRKKAVRVAENEMIRQALDTAGCRESKEAPGEREELLAELRRGVFGLPESTRQMVALYFGAGLSQEEIGKELEVSQTTVSMRITSAMNELRANLGKAGFAAAVPMLESGALQDAILESGQAPSGLLSKIQGELANVKLVSRRITSASVTGKAMAVVAALAVATGAGWYGLTRTEPSTQNLDSGAPVRRDKSVTSSPPSNRFHKVWNFKSGAHPDLKVVKGEWRWEPEAEKLPAGMLAPHTLGETLVQLPHEAPPERCWHVRIRGCLVKMGPKVNYQMIAAWSVREPPAEYTRWSSTLPLSPLSSNRRFVSDSYFMDEWEINVYWNADRTKIEGAFVFRHAPNAQRKSIILASLSNCIVEEVQLSEVLREEIPKDFRDPERVIKEFELTPKNYVQRIQNKKASEATGVQEEP